MTLYKVWLFECMRSLAYEEDEAKYIDAASPEEAAIAYAERHSDEPDHELTNVAVREGLTGKLRTFDVYCRKELCAGDTSFIWKGGEP